MPKAFSLSLSSFSLCGRKGSAGGLQLGSLLEAGGEGGGTDRHGPHEKELQALPQGLLFRGANCLTAAGWLQGLSIS